MSSARDHRVRRSGDAGFTVVELMVAITLLGIVSTVVLGGVTSIFRASTHAESRIEALTALQATVANVGREIRAADSRDVSGAALGVATPTRLQADIFRGGERIRFDYEVTGTSLVETRSRWADPQADPASTTATSTSTRTVIRTLDLADGPLFGYFDSSGRCITGCDGITTAVIDLSSVAEVRLNARRDMGASRPAIEVSTQIKLRNR